MGLRAIFVFGFAKSDRSNLSAAEIKTFKRAAKVALGLSSAALDAEAGTRVAAGATNGIAIGRNAAVKIEVPTVRSVTLNRVVTPAPSVIAGRLSAFTRSTARSVSGSLPTTWASSFLPSASATSISSAPSTTWWLVRT